MPIYAYKCESCGHQQDLLQKMSDPLLTICPSCGAATFSKQVTAAGFQLKGSGWYVTDFRNGNTGAKPAADGAADKAEAGADAPAKDGAATDKPAGGAKAADGEKRAEGAKADKADKAGKAADASAAPAAAPAAAPSAAPAAPKAEATKPPSSGI